MRDWMLDYVRAQKAALDSIPTEAVQRIIDRLRLALQEDRQVFVFGNGGSAANASHFATDLGKGASDKLSRRFRVLSLNDNVGWLTALGNDYAYEDVFVGQLQNYARAGDLVLVMSVSGNSPNLVKALVFLDDSLLPSTSNAVERGNRRHRKMQKTVYRVRSRENIVQRIAFDMQREAQAPGRAQATATLHLARTG